MKYLILCLLIGGMGLSIPAHAVLSSADIQGAYLKSYDAEKKGKLDDAVKALESVTKDYPNGYTLNLRLAYLNYKNKKHPAALENYDKANQALPYSLDPKLGKMVVLGTQERYADVEAVGYQVLNLDYLNYSGNLRLAYALRMQKKYDIAEKVALKMLSLYPVDISFLTEYGILLYLKDLQKSKNVFQDILILDPNNTAAKDYIKLIDKLLTPSSSAAVPVAKPAEATSAFSEKIKK